LHGGGVAVHLPLGTMPWAIMTDQGMAELDGFARALGYLCGIVGFLARVHGDCKEYERALSRAVAQLRPLPEEAAIPTAVAPVALPYARQSAEVNDGIFSLLGERCGKGNIQGSSASDLLFLACHAVHLICILTYKSG
jgi:hypothetical protein